MRLTRTLQVTACAAVLLAATACGSSDGSSSGGGLNPPDLNAQSKLGKSEGEVNLIAWAG